MNFRVVLSKKLELKAGSGSSGLDTKSSSLAQARKNWTFHGQETAFHKKLVDAVVRNDIMVDKLILKDVQLTVANDDNYFVFEDVVLQV